MKKSISVFVALTVIFSFWAVPAYSSYNNNSAQPVTVEEVGDPVVSGRYTYIINADGNTITLTATSLSSTTASINIPSEIDGFSVTGLGDSLFSGFTKLTAVTIPDGIKTMGMYVFRNTKIVSINIPKSVENIDRTFYSCTALKTVTVADDNQYYTAQNNVLYNKDKSTLVYYPSALTDVMFAIPSTVKRIANSAFALAKLRSITLNEGLEEIDDFAFSACTALASVNLPNSLISIGIGTFSGCAISEVKIPSSLKLADGAFRNTKNLTMITVDTENRAFIVTNGVLYTADGTKIVCCPAGSQVTKFAIPTEVTEIGNSAFSYQTNLATVSGTENLTTISDYAFYSCSSLTQIGKTDNIEFVGASAFYACGISKFQLPNVKTIGAYAFRQNTALTNVEIGDTNISLGIATFAGCTNLVSVRLSDNLTQLSNILFNDCSKLSEVNIPKKLTKIGDSVFYGCSSISEVDLPQGCEGIGQSAFNGCSVLERINIPVSLTYIENSSFSGCTKLAYVYYAGNISQWNNIKIDSGNINLTNATIYYADLTTPIPLPSATPYNGPTASPSATPKPTVSPTATPRPTAEPTATPTQKPTVTATPMPTPNYNWAIDDYSNKIVKVEVPSDMADGTAAVVYIAKYGSDGGLEDYETIDFTTQSGRTQYKLTGKNDITATATEKVKVMLWDNTENCTPLCEAFDAAVPADKGAKAFPGAEGPGKYTTGARGTGNIYEPATSVYHVTNLNDSGEGSFRDAVRNNSNSIVVFDVGGTINIKKPLEISGSNLTILGQTAPGDGITITGANVQVGGTNNIVRYLRIRPGTVNGLECDGFGGYIENCIIDHCSASYSVDECLTFYSNRNVTVQNCISSESLKNSIHSKGDHGYGGIWGGTNTSYHHNLMATHDSRTPRLDRQLSGTDVRNNIIYNWGQTNSAYGGESVATDGEYCGIDTYVNWVNNYYKQGPGTASKLMSRIFDTSSPKEYPSYFYFSGNYMTGYPEVTADNTKGVRINAGKGMVFLSDPVDMSENIPFESAEDTYNTLLRHVGASLPKRDETDARVVSDTVNGTGRIIDATQEVGDVMQYPETKRVFEIPSEWKVQNEMDSNAETDIVQSGKWAGYTWIEAYVNDWTESQETPSNPQIVVSSPAISSLGSEINGIKVKTGGTTTVTSGTPIEYKATVIPTSGTTITKTELWINGSVSKTYAGSNQIEDTVSLDPGTYFLTSMAYNNKGEATRSTESIVVVTE